MGVVMAEPRARDGVPTTARDRAGRAPSAGAWLPWAVVAIGIVWLAAKLWAAHEQISGNAGGTVAIATAALAVPSVVQATALGGLAGGLAARLVTDHLWVRATSASRRWPRLVAAGVGGLIIGLAAMGAILGVYGDVPSIGGVAATVAITGFIIGAFAGLGRRPVVAAAALAAAIASFVVDTILNSGTVLGHMMAALGAGSKAITDCDRGAAVASCAKVVNANSLVSHIDSVIVGLVAGLVAFWYLRRRGGRLAFPAYLLAGAATGLLLLLAEVLTHLGAGGLLHVARSISPDDQTVIDLLAGNRVIHGLLVLFIGAFVALLSFGRTLGPATTTAGSRPAATTAGSRPAATTAGSRPAATTAGSRPAAGARARAGAPVSTNAKRRAGSRAIAEPGADSSADAEPDADAPAADELHDDAGSRADAADQRSS
jgi:hypothetical protein